MIDNELLALDCARIAISKKAHHTVLLKMTELSSVADYFVITSGMNERQVQAIADAVVKECRAKGHTHHRIEGYAEGRWILVDLGSVIIHVFHDYLRDFYDLDALWAQAPRVKIPEQFYSLPSGVSTHEDSNTHHRSI